MGSTIENEFPALFKVADDAALKYQKWHFGLTVLGLGAGVLAAIGSALTTNLTDKIDLGGSMSAVGFLVGVAVTFYLLFGKGDQAWYRNRAAAESIKTLAWQYSMKGGEFDGADETDAFAVNQQLRRIGRRLMKVETEKTVGKYCRVTPAMTSWRDRSFAERREAYLVERVEDQLGYYSRKADWHARRARWWLSAMALLQIVGLVLALLRAFNIVNADVLGIAATGAAAVLAWIQTKDSQNLAESFRTVRQDLDEINEVRGQGASQPQETEWSSFVRDCEAVMSREHTMWLARRDTPAEP